jgi:serine/threonine protein kinase
MAETAPDGNPVDELAEEFARRLRAGEHPSVEEYAARHPGLADEIRTVLSAVAVVEQHKPGREETLVPAVRVPPRPERMPERVGGYRIVREVGRGGMGVVYEAEEEALGRRVAVKLLPDHLLASDNIRARFYREARAAARLHHTNIVPVFAVGSDGGHCFYVMQLIEGRGLDRVIGEAQSTVAGDARNPLQTAYWVRQASPAAEPASPRIPGPPRRPAALGGENPREFCRTVARIGADIADALAYAHAQGVVHRDVKPSNLLLDGRGTVWVTDFGVARVVEEANLTQSGDLPGTLAYMPPERFAGRPGDERGDVYSLGVTLYELLTLRPAFPETNPQHLMGLIACGLTVGPRALNPDVPADLETVVLKAAAKDPAERYATAAELADDLRRFLDDRPIRAKRVGLWGRAARWARRSPALAGATAAVFLLMLAVTGMSVALSVQAERRRQALAEAHAEVEAALKAEKAQREEVEAVSGLALAALNRVYERYAPTRLVVSPPATAAGVELPARPAALPPDAIPVLDDLLRTYERIARSGRAYPRLRERAAEANHRIGDIRQRLGRFEEAAAAYQEAIDLYGLTPDAPDVPLKLARARNELGRTLRVLHRFDEAVRSHEEAIRALAEAPGGLADRPEARYEMASAYQAIGRRDMLMTAPPGPPPGKFDRPPPPDEPGRGPPGKPKNGPPAAKDGPTRWAVELLKPLAEAEHPSPEYLHLLARCYRDLAPRPRIDETSSESNAERAVRLLRRLAAEYPDVPDYRFDLCEALGDPGGPSGRPPEADADPRAQDWLEEAIRVADELVRQYPNVPEYAAARARYHDRLGLRLFRAGRLEEAERFHRRAVADQEGLVKEYPGAVSYAVWLGLMERSLGDVLDARGQLPEARARLESATARVDALWRKEPRLAGLKPFLAMAYRDLARVLDRSGEPALAAEALRKGEAFGPDWRPIGPRPK